MLIGGLACIVAVFLAEKSTEATTTVFVGKLFIAGSFAVRILVDFCEVSSANSPSLLGDLQLLG